MPTTYIRPRVRCVLVQLSENGPTRVHEVEIDGKSIIFTKANLDMSAGDPAMLTISFFPTDVTVETLPFGERA